MPRRLATENIPYSLDHSSDNLVNVGTLGTFFEDSDGDWTIAFWIKNISNAFESPFGLAGVGNRRFFFDINRTGEKEGALNIFLRDSAGNLIYNIWGDAGLVRGQWFHLIINKSANTSAGTKLYVNGVESSVTTNNSAGTFVSDAEAASFAIGASDTAAARSFSGKTSKLYVWGSSLSASEMADVYAGIDYPSGELAGYDYDEGAGTTLGDTTGNYDGTLDAAAMWSADSPRNPRTSVA